MELMKTTDLFSLITKDNNYSENFCKYVALKILQGLAFLHAHSILHRQVDLAYVLVSGEGNVKLQDFGIGMTNERHERDENYTNWAPEMLQSLEYTTTVDIWQYGLLLMELANGELPYKQFRNRPFPFLIEQIVDMPVPPIQKKWSNTFQEFVALCMEKDGTKRPTAHELLSHPFLKGAEHYREEVEEFVNRKY